MDGIVVHERPEDAVKQGLRTSLKNLQELLLFVDERRICYTLYFLPKVQSSALEGIKGPRIRLTGRYRHQQTRAPRVRRDQGRYPLGLHPRFQPHDDDHPPQLLRKQLHHVADCVGEDHHGLEGRDADFDGDVEGAPGHELRIEGSVHLGRAEVAVDQRQGEAYFGLRRCEVGEVVPRGGGALIGVDDDRDVLGVEYTRGRFQ